MRKKKSQLIGIILTLFLGPFGLIYSIGWKAAIFGIVVWIVFLSLAAIVFLSLAAEELTSLLYFATVIVLYFVLYFATVIVSIIAIRNHNKKVGQAETLESAEKIEKKVSSLSSTSARPFTRPLSNESFPVNRSGGRDSPAKFFDNEADAKESAEKTEKKVSSLSSTSARPFTRPLSNESFPVNRSGGRDSPAKFFDNEADAKESTEKTEKKVSSLSSTSARPFTRPLSNESFPVNRSREIFDKYYEYYEEVYDKYYEYYEYYEEIYYEYYEYYYKEINYEEIFDRFNEYDDYGEY